MANTCFHAVSIKVAEDPMEALEAALATATRQLDDQIRCAEVRLDDFRLSGISHAHTLTYNSPGVVCAQVTAIASCEYHLSPPDRGKGPAGATQLAAGLS